MNILAVLVTFHNRKEKTLACLASLFNCSLPTDYLFDVFLVDDGSTDGTSEAVLAKFPMVNIISGDGDLYWNRGMYLAWITAVSLKDYDYYLWLNDDAILFEYALKLMLEYSNAIENKRIIVGATCSQIDGTVTYSGFNFPNKKLNPNGSWQDCDFFNGNIVLIPAFVYRQVGLLDKRFRHALGDFDYGMRATKLGLIHALSPQFLGTCEDHTTDPPWRNNSVPIYKRLKYLYSPLGNNPFEFFAFDKRHNGLFIASLHFLSIHFRAIFPQLWKNSNHLA